MVAVEGRPGPKRAKAPRFRGALLLLKREARKATMRVIPLSVNSAAVCLSYVDSELNCEPFDGFR